MKVCVFGLWHLGCVTAACLAAAGHRVTGLDFDAGVVAGLVVGRSPLFEPGLADLISAGLKSGGLDFVMDPAVAVREAQVVWVAFDTPVDDDDNADVEFVVNNVRRLFPYLESGQELLISSQLPVGTTARLEKLFSAAQPGVAVSFSYSPENLRLGKAIAVFTKPDRVVIGARRDESRPALSDLFAPFTGRIEWMSVESAEMTKHALNAFLATSVTFINEIAELCEQVGADAKDVERGLKTDVRIGPRAYLGPGVAFAGGTLARDIGFLTMLAERYHLANHLFPAVRAGNDAHKDWARRRLAQLLGDLHDKTVAVWGLTYKPGTDTLRRSSALELCNWLAGQGVRVQTHDPMVKDLPGHHDPQIQLCKSPLEAVRDADALVMATEWPDYLAVPVPEILAAMRRPLVLDANRFLAGRLEDMPGIVYVTVGRALKS